tara:strand:- start:94268 stop:96244 length:1977 start_codon:yes stop_codon:yes gene_type:complete
MAVRAPAQKNRLTAHEFAANPLLAANHATLVCNSGYFRAMKLLLVVPLVLLAACEGEPTGLDGLAIRGRVFNDIDRNGLQEEDEAGIAGITVFVDLNRDGLQDAGEPSSATSIQGDYAIRGLEAGEYVIRQVLPFGYRNEVDANARVLGADTPAGAPKLGRGQLSIIGGADVDASNYPFMVSMGFGTASNFSQYCGGALVSDEYVLTAAHCSEGSEPEDVAVMLGSQLADEGGHVVRVAEILVHPDWTGEISEGFDMSLLRLDQRINLEELGLRTIPLMRPDDEALAGAGALSTTIGWGVTDNPSLALQEVHIPLTSDEVCAEAYPQVRSFETQICAGAPSGGLDSCQGDSGGPLLVRDPFNHRWLHAGITSWGRGCGLPGKPGIYGRTSAMSRWALGQMRGESIAYTLNLRNRNASVDFSNEATTRELRGDVDVRWSLSQFEMLGIENNTVEASQAVSFQFSLFGDATAPASANFTCTFDPDDTGPIAATQFPCEAGVNQVDFAGYDDGIYLTRLDVASPNRQGGRTLFVRAGEPPFSEESGTLQASDGTDPDFGGDYYIDYFELINLEPGTISILDIDATFGVQLAIYDASERDSSGGGRIMQVAGGSPDNTVASLQLIPEANRSYLVGVSSVGKRGSGDYTLRVVNSGTAVATEL